MFKWFGLTLCLCTLAACSVFHSSADNAPVYIVFFHYDSADLTPDARLIVDQAAKAAHDIRPTGIEIAGYTDETGPKGGRHLADPRFAAVAQALVADGIDSKLLTRAQLTDAEAALPANADRRVEIRLIHRSGG